MFSLPHVKLDPSRLFGVEIELIAPVEPYEVAEALAEVVECYDEKYNHITRDYWKIVEDCTLYADEWGEHPMEIVSPPLLGEEGLAELVNVLTVLNELGCTVNTTCGLHIHHDAEDMDTEAIRILTKTYLKYEDVIDKLLDPSRRTCRHAGPLRFYGTSLTQMFARIDEASSVHEVYRIWWDRYVKLNLESLQVHGTVEFRQHEGSLDVCAVAAWLSLTQSMVTSAVAKTRQIEAVPHTPTLVGFMLAAGACPEVRQHYAHKYRHAA